MKKTFQYLFSALLMFGLLQGCATSIKASSTQNPAPKEAFSAFGRIELKQTRFREGLDFADQAGMSRIHDNLVKDLTPSLDEWNKRPDNGRKLVIEPVIEEMSFKHGARRVLLGPLAGSSGVLLRLKISDANGNVIAHPEFFRRADAWAAGFLMGVHDNLMLTFVANLASNYVKNNFDKAVGGPTGADEKAVSSK